MADKFIDVPASVEAQVLAEGVTGDMEAQVLLHRFAWGGLERLVDKLLKVVYSLKGGVSVQDEEIVGVHDQNDELLIRPQRDASKLFQVDGLSVGVLTEDIHTAFGAGFFEGREMFLDPVAPGLAP